MSAITTVPAADPPTARAHFAARLSLETDADDVGSAIRDGDVDFLLIDARSPAAYEAGHLPGAANLPHRTIDAAVVSGLPEGPIVVYCWSPGCNAATKAGVRLAEHGRAAKEMIGGYDYYVSEGFPVVTGTRPTAGTA